MQGREDRNAGKSVTELRFTVPDMTCDHCVAAVQGELEKLPSVTAVSVDLGTKAVVVMGTGLEQDSIWAAVAEAGYEAVA